MDILEILRVLTRRRITPTLLVLCCFACSGSLSSKRDFGEYETFGPVETTTSSSPQFLKLREFLWTHYTERKLGYAQATFQNKHGGSNRLKIFVEPDTTGQWGLLVYSERMSYTRGPGQVGGFTEYRWHDKKGQTFWGKIDRVELGFRSTRVVPEDKVLEPFAYQLRLHDSTSGKTTYW